MSGNATSRKNGSGEIDTAAEARAFLPPDEYPLVGEQLRGHQNHLFEQLLVGELNSSRGTLRPSPSGSLIRDVSPVSQPLSKTALDKLWTGFRHEAGIHCRHGGFSEETSSVPDLPLRRFGLCKWRRRHRAADHANAGSTARLSRPG